MKRFLHIGLVFLLAAAGPSVLGAGAGSREAAGTYIVTFDAPPLAAWRGGETRDGRRLKATAPEVTGHARLEPEAPESRAYLKHLDRERKAVLGRAGQVLGRALSPRHVYRYALNGVALELDAAEVGQLARTKGVSAVVPDELHRPETDAGPAWIGAPAVWDGAAPFSGAGNQGEGVVIGVIDSGIDAGHEAFAATGGDGHTHTNPRGRRFGLCDSGAPCNDKLIGIYDFTDEGSEGSDTTGHGTHVASIAAGNRADARLEANTDLELVLPVSGVAPHANLISYKACRAAADEVEPGCPVSNLLAAIEQAIEDRVDVINYSIGGRVNRGSPWQRPDAIAMRNAVRAGVVVVSSAGNRGPREESITNPATAPWVIAAANATHDRRFVNRLVEMGGGAGIPPMDMVGAGFTAGTGRLPIVHARDFGHPLCGQGPMDFPPTGQSNPFPGSTFNGRIVVCDRGVYARVEKGFNVREAGARGYVLANTAEWGEDIVSDDHFLPGVHLGFEAGERLREWLAGGGSRMARISGTEAARNEAFGDVVAGSSSRGPAPFTPNVMKPDLAAPGTDVLGANRSESEQGGPYGFLSGTSMASPHVAGAAALVRAAHPSWSVAAVHSALVTTADAGAMSDAAATTPPGARVRGAGRVDPAAAVAAGLVLEVGAEAFEAADPDRDGDPASLNLPTLSQHACFQSCEWTRTVTSVRDAAVTWRVEVDAPDDVRLEVTPARFTLASEGAGRTLEIGADVRDATIGEWIDGSVRLVPETSGADTPAAVLPLDVFVSGGGLPDAIEVDSAGRGGSRRVTLDGLVALPDAEFSASGPVRGRSTRRNLAQDPQPRDPYGLNEGSTFFERVTVAPGDRMLVAETVASTAHDIDLFVGRDGGDGEPGMAEELCAGISPEEIERCVLMDPQAGEYWVLVQNWQARRDADSVHLITAVVPGADDGLHAVGPGRADTDESFDVRLGWDRTDMDPGSRWYGVLGVGTAPDRPGNVGRVPVILDRAGDEGGAPLALAPGEPRRFSLSGDSAYRGVFIDLPPDAERLELSVQGGRGGPDLQLYARREQPFSDGSVSTLEQEADAVSATSLEGARLVLEKGDGLEPGRWYVVPYNGSSSPTEFTLEATVDTEGQRADFQPGMWFNPQRSGHGIDLNRSGDTLFVVWFTYLEDGTPAWYLAVAPDRGSVWSAPLERFTWNGEEARSTAVGRVTLTFDSPESAVFSWRLHGITGSEPFRPCVGSGSCIPPGLETPVDFSGHWYYPQEPGWGDTIQIGGPFEVHTLYIYDDAGIPRWLQGVHDQHGEIELTEMFAFEGFCPTCERFEPATTMAGSLIIDYEDLGEASMLLDVTLPPEWPGRWIRNVEVRQLSDPAQ